ncbi:hypothetical protein THASP1DRAFT_33169, partial [Thamnocephalis sphaerospora]
MGQSTSMANSRRQRRKASMPQLRGKRSFAFCRGGLENASSNGDGDGDSNSGLPSVVYSSSSSAGSSAAGPAAPPATGASSRALAASSRGTLSQLANRILLRRLEGSSASSGRAGAHSPGIWSMLHRDEHGHLFSEPYGSPHTSFIDPEAVERADLTHEMVRYVQRSNYTAPIVQPKRILDVGCGTGRWAKEMARDFPKARV